MKEFIGDLSIGTHLNSHEAMATGSAFRAANGSYSFRARPVLLSDGLNFPIFISLETLEKGDASTGEKAGSETEKKSENSGDDTKTEKKAKKFSKNFKLFKKKARFGSKKKLTFTYDKDLVMTLRYLDLKTGKRELYKTIELTEITTIANVRTPS